ncbi:Gfo/Idh/MocA family oxidoreductase [Occallatibacter savannae]|uniref:Gfo/Idh/MocA family protein n=1 Tax=Occallatibacter savannae TaxID=1002691 RepID=UPI0030846A62
MNCTAAASKRSKAKGHSKIASQGKLRVAAVGAGAFGRNHLRVYRELEIAGKGTALVAAVEPDGARAAETSARFAIPVFGSVEELLRADLEINAASVAVPTVQHHAVASALLAAGIDVLVEKPLASTTAQADELIALAEKNGRILQVGHLERFNPAVLAVVPELKRPMFFEAHRLSIFTPRSLDVDVVLDLMIHDLDIVLNFVKSPIREVRAVGLPILSPKVDIANVRVEFESGCVANFTASRVSTERVRKLRFFQPRSYVSIDYARQDLLVIRLDADITPEIAAAIAGGQVDPAVMAKIAAANTAGTAELGASPNPGLSFLKPPVTPGEPLRLEIESFLGSVRSRRQPLVTAGQGRDALALALEIQTAMAAHAHRAGLGDFFASA